MALKVKTEDLHNIINEELTNILQEVEIDWEADEDDDSVAVDVRPDVPLKSVPVEVVQADQKKSIEMALRMANKTGVGDHSGLADYIRQAELDDIDEGDMATKHFSQKASESWNKINSDPTRTQAVKIYDSAIRKWNRERASQIKSQEVKPLLTFSMHFGNKDLAKQFKDWTTDPRTGKRHSTEELTKRMWARNPARAAFRQKMIDKGGKDWDPLKKELDTIAKIRAAKKSGDLEDIEDIDFEERDSGSWYDFSGQKEKSMQAGLNPFAAEEFGQGKGSKSDSEVWKKIMSRRQYEAYGDSWIYPVSPQDIDPELANTLEGIASDWLPSATTDDWSNPLTWVKYVPFVGAVGAAGKAAIKGGKAAVTATKTGTKTAKEITRLARQQARDGRKIFKSAKAESKVAAKEAKETRKALQKLENRANNPLRRTPKAEELANARAAAKKAEDAASGAADRLKRAEQFKDNSQQYYKNVKNNPKAMTDIANKADEAIKTKAPVRPGKAEPPGGWTPGGTKVDTLGPGARTKPYYLQRPSGGPDRVVRQRMAARKEVRQAEQRYGRNSPQAQKAIDKHRKIHQKMNKQISDDILKPGTNSNKVLEAQKKALLDDMNAAAAARTAGNKAAVEAAEKSVIGKLGKSWETTKGVLKGTAFGLTAAHLGTSYYLSEKYGIPFTMGMSMVNKWLHDEAGMTFLEDFIGEVPDDMKKKLEAANRDLKKINISKERARELARQQTEQDTPIRVDENYIIRRVVGNLLTAMNHPSARISK
tara:strand:+ start:61 stop:2355 length:2295 start_codon:yes stop_codon:yes gene_type:complete